MPVTSHPGVPELLALHAARPDRYPYLLQTLDRPGWDILFGFPRETRVHDRASPFLPALDAAWAGARRPPDAQARASGLPFRGGWFLYLGYELLHEVEPAVRPRGAPEEFPLACAARIPAAVLVDRARARTFLFAEDDAGACLATMRADLERVPAPAWRPPALTRLQEEPAASFLAAVDRAGRYIRDGDAFQVNLARAWRAELAPGVGAADLYARLRAHNPAPFAGLADFGTGQIVSSSPERLVRVRDGVIEARPIAGTHPRSTSEAEDERLRRELLASRKERAEHVMLVDLARNDLGRVCTPGSVRVEELMSVASYAHVHHIESNVRGTLAAGMTPAQVLRALFPGGTITGCPKVRAMQIINELEDTPRAAYTGSLGYLNHDGDMDLNILIRSFMLSGRRLGFKTGAGIVADSVPARELAETRHKAKGLLRALGADPG